MLHPVIPKVLISSIEYARIVGKLRCTTEPKKMLPFFLIQGPT